MDANQMLELRKQSLYDTLALKKPERVIIKNNAFTGQLAHTGIKVKEAYANPEKYVDTVAKFYEDFEVDCISNPLVNPLEVIWDLGRNTYFVTPDGFTVQHQEDVPMLETEYPELIKNPKEFITNVLFPRKFPAVMQEGGYEVLKKAAKSFQKQSKMAGMYAKKMVGDYGVLSVTGCKSYPPFDVIFDRLRGFKGTMQDVRRRPEEVKEACNALLPMYLAPIKTLSAKYPYAVTTIHAPGFLRPKDFEELFWPTYEPLLMEAYNRGSATEITCEDTMYRYFDMFNDLPQGALIVKPERDDPIKSYQKLKGHQAFVINYPVAYIRHKTKDECLDYLKEILDSCTEGGFLFGIDVGLLSKTDVNAENLAAVYHMVHTYPGK